MRSERPTLIYEIIHLLKVTWSLESTPSQTEHKHIVHTTADTRAATFPKYDVKSDLRNTD